MSQVAYTRVAGDVSTRRSSRSNILCVVRRKSLRSQLYRAARDLGNVEAASKGPAAYGKRMVRRKVYRRTNRTTGGFLRRLLG
jgi:hypothetical protein